VHAITQKVNKATEALMFRSHTQSIDFNQSLRQTDFFTCSVFPL